MLWRQPRSIHKQQIDGPQPRKAVLRDVIPIEQLTVDFQAFERRIDNGDVIVEAEETQVLPVVLVDMGSWSIDSRRPPPWSRKIWPSRSVEAPDPSSSAVERTAQQRLAHQDDRRVAPQGPAAAQG